MYKIALQTFGIKRYQEDFLFSMVYSVNRQPLHGCLSSKHRFVGLVLFFFLRKCGNLSNPLILEHQTLKCKVDGLRCEQMVSKNRLVIKIFYFPRFVLQIVNFSTGV